MHKKRPWKGTMHDLVIRGGAVVDRTGCAPQWDDVAGDRRLIRYVGTVEAGGRRRRSSRRSS